MLTSLLAATLCISPSFGDLDGPSAMRFERSATAPQAQPVAVSLAADSTGLSPSPLLTTEGRVATLLTLEQGARLREIDSELKTLAATPVGFKVLSAVGLLIIAAPVTYASVMAVVLAGVVIAELGVLGVIISPLAFAFGLVYSVPVWGWAIAGVGLAIVGLSHLGATATIQANAQARDAVLAERNALLDAMNGPSSTLPGVIPLTNIASF